MQDKSFSISGQWLGHFQYGPDYGPLFGEKVVFSLTLNDLGNGEFIGTCNDLEGVGSIPEPASIRGYVEGKAIHFVKEYPVQYEIADDNTLEKVSYSAAPILTYDGEYNEQESLFRGTWEIEVNLGPTIHGDEVILQTGKWEMNKI